MDASVRRTELEKRRAVELKVIKEVKSLADRLGEIRAIRKFLADDDKDPRAEIRRLDDEMAVIKARLADLKARTRTRDADGSPQRLRK